MTIIIMEKMGWTYEEYINSPKWIIDLLTEKQNIEKRVQNNQNE